ncbi:MAG: hypothetical protein IKP14_08485 [Clostridiales bacterium]|nr:hypothetical protein [Clostridiales bacterium]
MGKNKGKKKKFFVPLLILLIIVTLIMRAAIVWGLMYAVDQYTTSKTSSSSRSSHSSRRSSDRDDDDDDDDDGDSGWGGSSDPADMASWTVLVYMCGTDLETQNGFGSMAFDWMNDEDISDDINIIVETGGTLTWNNEDNYFSDDSVHDVDIPEDMLGRFQVKQDEVIDLGAVSLQSMGKAETLSDFISWGVQEFPAEHYMFVMWDHGYSEPYGNMEHDEIFYENGSGSIVNGTTTNVDTNEYYNDCLTLDEVREGFEDGGAHFDLIAFNTCLSGSMEIASAMATYADYMAASEEVIPAIIGIPMGYITYLSENPDCTGEDVGNEILSLYENEINSYTAAYSSDQDVSELFATGTMSLINLSCMEQIDELMGQFWQRLYYTTYSQGEFSSVINIASKCENYGAEGSMPGNLIDFRAFLNDIRSVFSDTDVDDELLEILNDNVVSVSGRARTNSYGMSVFFPSAVYPQAVRSSYESMLNTYGVDYTEDQMLEILHQHIGFSLDGYTDNIDFIDGYYWYAAFLQVRFSDYWTADNSVWNEVNSHLDPSYQNMVQISSENPEDVEYELTFDDRGNIMLNITSGAASVLSVEANVCYYYPFDTGDYYTLFGSEPVYSNQGNVSSYTYNPDCQWLNFCNYDITVYPLEDTADHTIYATPADINSVWSFIYIYYDKATDEYSLLYCASVDPESGVATNDIFNLEEGDEVEFLYYSVAENIGYETVLLIRPLFDSFTYDGSLNINRGNMFGTGGSDKVILVNFLIRDCFGNITDTAAVEITYGSNNEVVNVTDAEGYIDYTNLYEVTSADF